MPNHRMFSYRIANSAKFLQMPVEAQLLYFHMILRADDDGVVETYPLIKLLGTPNDNVKILIVKKFIKLLNEDQVMVIMDWTEHNKIRADRKVNSIYKNLLDKKNIKTLTPKPRSDVVGGARHTAIKKETSGLPYSFSYKIRKIFIGKKCPLCGKIMGDTNKNDTPSIQHNIPLSKGGKHELGNISIICTYCNITKKDIETDKLNAKEVANIWKKMNMDGQWTDNGRHKLSKDKLSKDEKINILSKEYLLSKLLLTLILQNTPTFKKPNLEKWAKEIDLMVRIDKRTHEQIEFTIKWCQQNDFWKANILSTKKLRKQFDTLVSQIKRDNKNKTIIC